MEVGLTDVMGKIFLGVSGPRYRHVYGEGLISSVENFGTVMYYRGVILRSVPKNCADASGGSVECSMSYRVHLPWCMVLVTGEYFTCFECAGSSICTRCVHSAVLRRWDKPLFVSQGAVVNDSI